MREGLNGQYENECFYMCIPVNEIYNGMMLTKPSSLSIPYIYKQVQRAVSKCTLYIVVVRHKRMCELCAHSFEIRMGGFFNGFPTYHCVGITCTMRHSSATSSV